MTLQSALSSTAPIFARALSQYTTLLHSSSVENHTAQLTKLVHTQTQLVAQFGTNPDADSASTTQRPRLPLGLTFFLRRTERKLERALHTLPAQYPKEQAHVQQLRDLQEEKARIISELKEERVTFLSNIILGLNDGLIELTGALVGFTFALRDTTVAGASGLITGIAASLSMAASAYLQSKHEPDGKSPTKAALYTGLAYLIVVVLLITPFFFVGSGIVAISIMGATVALIIAGVSYYSAVIFRQRFAPQFGEMLLFGAGTAIVAFCLGWLVDQYILS